MSVRILIIEDEAEIASYLRRGLTFEGFTAEMASTGAEGLTIARARPPDIVILDLGLPDMDGIDVARSLHAETSAAILMLTARDTLAEKITGLESGADDYLTKPFAFEELIARVRAMSRRLTARQQQEVLRFGPLAMNVAAREVRVEQRRVELTAKEFEVLEIFMRHPRQVLTREQVYEHVWAYDFGHDSNVLEVYVRTLRQKLEAAGAPRLLHTLRGFGYVLRDQS